jgi:hypothetical protein
LDLAGIELRFELVDFTWNTEHRLSVLAKTIADYIDAFWLNTGNHTHI